MTIRIGCDQARGLWGESTDEVCEVSGRCGVRESFHLRARASFNSDNVWYRVRHNQQHCLQNFPPHLKTVKGCFVLHCLAGDCDRGQHGAWPHSVHRAHAPGENDTWRWQHLVAACRCHVIQAKTSFSLAGFGTKSLASSRQVLPFCDTRRPRHLATLPPCHLVMWNAEP